VALMPFARNAATAFISPTKTPEYLAAGKPVVSTSIRDVVEPYGRLEIVRIADSVADFVRACAEALADPDGSRSARADAFLAQTSWDDTWWRIRALLDKASGEGPAAPVRHHATRIPELSLRGPGV
jgi:UDP-galactopyranose mutase